MDGTRVGITFQEAQAVIRNIRKRHCIDGESSFSWKYKPTLTHQGENDETSSYFTETTIGEKSEGTKTNPAQLARHLSYKEDGTYENISLFPNTTTRQISHIERQKNHEISSIAKRLEAFKKSSVMKEQDNIIINQSKHDPPQQARRISSSSVISANQTSITSYLAKVKANHTKDVKKLPESKKTSFISFSDACFQEVKLMSSEKRELIKKRIERAKTVACTAIYDDGSNLLRPTSSKNQIKRFKEICLSFTNNDSVSCSKDCTHILFSLPSSNKDDNYSCDYIQWLRNFFSTLMLSECNKIIYDAQKFIKMLLKVLDIDDYNVCFKWLCYDPMIAAWLIDPDNPPENYDFLLHKGFGKPETINKSKENNDKNNHVLTVDMYSLLSLMPDMLLSLQEKDLWGLFSDVEMKISPILAVMELTGVEIDTARLLHYSKTLEKKIKTLEEEGHQCAGHTFHLNSTQQLRHILFNELKLDKNVQKHVARTQVMNYKSTSENVLKQLQDFHPLPKIILEYRSVTKVKSTYVDGIRNVLDDGKVYTSWNQTCTATGRLTSTNPNIQAIPKNALEICSFTKPFIIGRGFESEWITPRKAFKSRYGWSFISSDFQSVELRLLAHFSQDPLLLRVFNECSGDMFVQLAALWLSVDPESVKRDDRERAKRVVYSVIYGVGKERLSETLNVSADEAKSFSNSFLATFTGLKHFIQSCIKECKRRGYVTTILGRRRLLPGINATDPQLRSQSERKAVNFVIQGSAADICKMGMILVVQSLQRKNLQQKARLIVQIHDELVFEVLDSCVGEVKELLKTCLEDTYALCNGRIKLKTDLKVSLSFGKTWAEMKPF